MKKIQLSIKKFLITAHFFTISLLSLILPISVSAADVKDIFGSISPPPGVAEYNQQAGPDGIGIIIFISRVIRVATIFAGVWSLVNFILAGWDYINSSGDPKAHTSVSNKLLNTVIGLALIVLSYTIAGIIGLVIFGDASYILNPKFESIGV